MVITHKKQKYSNKKKINTLIDLYTLRTEFQFGWDEMNVI